MTQRQINSLNMYNAVLQFLNDNNAAWNSNTIIAAAVTALGTTVTAIQKQAGAQQNGAKGYTAKKDQDLENLADLTYKLALRVKNYAVSINDLVLKQAVTVTRHELQNGKEADVLNRCKNIISKADGVASAAPPEYKITSQLIADATAAADLITPDTAERDVVSGAHSGTTTQLGSLFSTARNQLHTLDDLIEGDADDDSSDFVNNYFIMRRTNDHKGGGKKDVTDTPPPTK